MQYINRPDVIAFRALTAFGQGHFFYKAGGLLHRCTYKIWVLQILQRLHHKTVILFRNLLIIKDEKRKKRKIIYLKGKLRKQNSFCDI
jgi:hypothetical protein